MPAADAGRGIDAAVKRRGVGPGARGAPAGRGPAARRARAHRHACPRATTGRCCELAVQDRLSLLLIAATSYTDPEFGRVCARVRELCKEVDDHTLMVPALWRLAINQFMQSEIEAGLALSDELLDLRGDDPVAAQIAGTIVHAL